MVVYYGEGSKTTVISDARMREIVQTTLKELETKQNSKYERVVIVPPDFTRFHS